MNTIRAAISCLPCCGRPDLPDIEDPNQAGVGRDELEGLLQSEDDAVDTVSLHSSIGRGRSKKHKKKKNGKQRHGWGIAGRNRKTSGPKSVQLFGYHLFGRPVSTTDADGALASSDEDTSEDESQPRQTHGASTSTLQSVSDAALVEDSAIDQLAAGNPWKAPRTDEELAREELELAEAEEAAAGLLGNPAGPPIPSTSTQNSLPASPKDTDEPSTTRTFQASGESNAPAVDSVLGTPVEPDAPPAYQSPASEPAPRVSSASDDERAARHAKEIRRAIRAQRKRLKEAAEADAEAAAGGFDFDHSMVIPSTDRFEGFQGSGEDGVVVLPLDLTSAPRADDYGPFVHSEGFTTLTQTSSSSRSDSRSRRSRASRPGAQGTHSEAAAYDLRSEEEEHGQAGLGMEYAQPSRSRRVQEGGSGSGSTSQKSKSVSWTNGSDNGGPKRKSKPPRPQSSLLAYQDPSQPQYVPLPPSSAGSEQHYYDQRSHPLQSPVWESSSHHPHPPEQPMADLLKRHHRPSRSRSSHHTSHSRGSFSLPGAHEHSHAISPLAQEDDGFEGIPGGVFGYHAVAHPQEEFDGIPGGLDSDHVLGSRLPPSPLHADWDGFSPRADASLHLGQS